MADPDVASLGHEASRPSTVVFPAPDQTTHVGQPMERVDARSKVLGQARYAAEFDPPNLSHAVMVRSPIARGSVTRVDAAEARASAGVLAVFHAGRPLGLRSPEGTPDATVVERRPPFQSPDVGAGEIGYAGQIVAMVVAETLEQAEHAARLLLIDYEAADAAVTLDQGRDRIEVPAERNGVPIQFEKGNVSEESRTAAVRVDHDYEIAAEHHHPMELLSTTAFWEKGTLTLYDTTQGVVGTRNAIATSLNVPASKVRVVCPYVGGGFGSKGPLWPHIGLVAAAARELDRPVRI